MRPLRRDSGRNPNMEPVPARTTAPADPDGRRTDVFEHMDPVAEGTPTSGRFALAPGGRGLG